jgi:methyl-accepting chemotaxis protein
MNQLARIGSAMRRSLLQSVIAKTVLGVAILLGVGLLTLRQLSVITDAAMEGLAAVAEREVEATAALGAARAALINKIRIVNRLTAEVDRDAIEAMAGEADRRDGVFRREMARVAQATGGRLPEIAVIGVAFDALIPLTNGVIDARLEGRTMADSPAFADRFREMALAAETLDRRMAQAVVDGSAALRAVARALRDGIERSIGRTVLIAGAGLLIGFAVSLLVIHHAVARPLRALSATALGILGGDRTRTVPSLRRRDEIGDIAGAVQRLKETLAANDTLGAETLRSAEKVASASGDAAIAVAEVSAGSRRQMASVDLITLEVSLTSTTIGAISDMTATARDRTRGAADRVEAAQRQITTLIGAVRGISAISEQISQITQRIAAIATRSNILSLNAAIEAARAGEHGRGFGVVADEVNHLSVQTTELANEIAMLATSSGETIHQGVEIAVAVNAAMAEVVGVVEETGTLAMEVARAIEEQRGIIGTIDGRVAALREISRTNAVASEHITAAMNDLAALADGTRRRAGAARGDQEAG